MVVVQEIKTVWSKYSRSRGSHMATLRGQVPTTMLLPDVQSRLPNQVLYHQCVFGEANNFQKDHSQIEFLPLMKPTILECTYFEIVNSELEVRYFYNYKTGGMPARTYMDATGTTVPECKKAFTLVEGQWGQIRHNRRYTLPYGYVGDEGTWLYEQTTINIGLLNTYDQAFFSSKRPNFNYDKLAHLW